MARGRIAIATRWRSLGLLGSMLVWGSPGTARADTVRDILPTGPNADLQTSLDTVKALFQAIHNDGDPYPGGSRTIKLREGVYDLRAVMLPGEFDANGELLPPPVGHRRTTDGVDPEAYVQWTGLAYEGIWGYAPLPGRHNPSGVPIAGRENLTIEGAVDEDGKPLTTLLGNPHSFPVLSLPERIFRITGDDEGPSRSITIQDLRFEEAGTAVECASFTPTFDHVWRNLVLEGFGPTYTSEPLGEGTVDVTIQRNEFVHPEFVGVLVLGRHVRTTIRSNEIVTGYRGLETIGDALSGFHIEDLHIEGNVIAGAGPVWNNFGDGILLWDRHVGTVARGNTVVGGNGGVLVLPSHGMLPDSPPSPPGGLIEDNTLDGQRFAGVAIFGQSGWTVSGNTVRNTYAGVWAEWGGFIFPNPGPVVFRWTPAEDNHIVGNDLRNNFVGVLLGAYARGNTCEGNQVTGSASGIGILLNGPQNLRVGSGIRFGPASHNTIIVTDPAQIAGLPEPVVDSSRYQFGVGSSAYSAPITLPFDDDGDGQIDEDPIDGSNNDGDVLRPDGIPRYDEDPEEYDNVFIGVTPIVAPRDLPPGFDKAEAVRSVR